MTVCVCVRARARALRDIETDKEWRSGDMAKKMWKGAGSQSQKMIEDLRAEIRSSELIISS